MPKHYATSSVHPLPAHSFGTVQGVRQKYGNSNARIPPERILFCFSDW